MFLSSFELEKEFDDKNNLPYYEPTTQSKNKDRFYKKDTLFITEDFNLKEDTIIKAKKVILDMVKIQTLEHSLIIIADDFLSNHSVIQNFKQGQEAEAQKDGRHGGTISILTNKASGNLKLVLNGENGGKVSRRRGLTSDERESLKGEDGKNGREAIYKKFCEIETFLILQNRRCRFECVLKQTRGEDGKEGKQGFPGEDGRRGGNTGWYELK